MITVVYLLALRIRFIGTTHMHMFMCLKAPKQIGTLSGHIGIYFQKLFPALQDSDAG